jgi:hypothetical protein
MDSNLLSKNVLIRENEKNAAFGMGEDVSRTTTVHDEELLSLSWALHFFCHGITSVSLARQMGLGGKTTSQVMSGLLV